MVCKNCGADLKPGMKYCLNCGNYLDDDDDNLVEEKEDDIVLDNELDDLPMSYSDNSDNTYVDLGKNDYKKFNSHDNNFKVEVSSSKKKKSLKMSDLIIYGILFLIIIVSALVLVTSIAKGNKTTNTVVPPSTPVKDSVVKCDNYTITFSGELIYNKEGSVIFISDGTNYSLSYKNTVDSFDKYSDMSLLRESLKSTGYNVLYEEKVDVDNNTFLLYKFKDSNTVKYLYLTKLNDSYVTMGVVEPISGGEWKKSLNLVNSINKSIKFGDNDNNASDNTDSVLNDAATSLYSVIK